MQLIDYELVYLCEGYSYKISYRCKILMSNSLYNAESIYLYNIAYNRKWNKYHILIELCLYLGSFVCIST